MWISVDKMAGKARQLDGTGYSGELDPPRNGIVIIKVVPFPKVLSAEIVPL